jgi:2'-5' RNA ligase
MEPVFLLPLSVFPDMVGRQKIGHMNERRLFFGIALSGAAKKPIMREMMKWETLPLFSTFPENLHVTMFFLGFIEDGMLPDIVSRAAELCTRCEPFDVDFSDIILAPEGKDPSMIWLQGVPSEGALALRNGLEQTFSSKRAENKRFSPHVTLARLRKSAWNKLETKPIFPKTLLVSESVSSLTLFESVSEDGKRKFVPIDEFPLGE